MACSSTSMTTAMPAPANGSTSSTACGARSASAYEGERYRLQDAICEPKPVRKPRPIIYAGGESEAAKTMIAETVRRLCHARRSGRGDRGEDRRHGGAARGDRQAADALSAWPPMRSSATARPRRGASSSGSPPCRPEPPTGFDNFEQWLSGTQLERELKLQEYSVSNRGLRPNLVGTPEQVRERIEEYEAAGLDLLLLQMSPQAEEMDRFADQVIAPMRARG